MFAQQHYRPRSVLITGASSGVGKALALAYAQEGVTLFLCGRNVERLEESVSLCRAKGAAASFYSFDVQDARETEMALQAAHKIAPLDLVIANAGVASGVLGAKETTQSTRTIFQTNVLGVMNTVLPAIELFKQKGAGQIALISSLAGYRGMASCPAYSASKACVKAWGEGLRGLLAPDRIAVSVICPGFIETPLTDVNRFKMPFLMQPDKAAAAIKKRLEKNPAIIAFPWQMAFSAWFGSILPAALAQPLMRRLPQKEK